VDLERSMADLSENSLMFNTSAQIITSKYKGMVSLIDGVK
jgi:flagellar basal body rod protein FlgB